MSEDESPEWATPEHKLSEEFVEFLRSITGKRARRVIDHILTYGYVTTEDLSKEYGYNHPPRGARDVREAGVPLHTKRVADSTGRTVGAYIFGDPSGIRRDRSKGRQALSKDFIRAVYETYYERCAVCTYSYALRYIQCDHRIPYEVAGDVAWNDRKVAEYMPLCGECQRRKSWSCEHCPNFTQKDLAVCATCYWASPGDYDHIATVPERRVDVVWSGEKELAEYDDLRRDASAQEMATAEFLKYLARRNNRQL